MSALAVHDFAVMLTDKYYPPGTLVEVIERMAATDTHSHLAYRIKTVHRRPCETRWVDARYIGHVTQET